MCGTNGLPPVTQGLSRYHEARYDGDIPTRRPWAVGANGSVRRHVIERRWTSAATASQDPTAALRLAPGGATE